MTSEEDVDDGSGDVMTSEEDVVEESGDAMTSEEDVYDESGEVMTSGDDTGSGDMDDVMMTSGDVDMMSREPRRRMKSGGLADDTASGDVIPAGDVIPGDYYDMWNPDDDPTNYGYADQSGDVNDYNRGLDGLSPAEYDDWYTNYDYGHIPSDIIWRKKRSLKRSLKDVLKIGSQKLVMSRVRRSTKPRIDIFEALKKYRASKDMAEFYIGKEGEKGTVKGDEDKWMPKSKNQKNLS